MKKKKLIYMGKRYDYVVYLSYPGEEQFDELGKLILNDYSHKHTSIEKNDLNLKVNRLNDYYASIYIINKQEHVKKRILVAASDGALFPTVDLAIDANENAQSIFEEEGVYGSYGIRDRKLLDNIIESTKHSVYFGEDQIPSLLRKAAVYWWKFAHYQVFMNGNKRTGLLVASAFMYLNYMALDFNQDRMYEISKGIARDELTVDDVYGFLLKNTHLTYDRLLQDYLK